MRNLSEKNYAELSAGIENGTPVDKIALTPGPMKRLKNNNEESRSQKMLIKWWSHRCKDFDIPEQLLFAIPNGMAFGGKEEWQRKTSAIRAKNAKLEGLRPGWPDLMLAVSAAHVMATKTTAPSVIQYHGLFIEMKTATGAVRPEQSLMLNLLSERGYHCVVCRSTEEAIREIEGYLS